MQTTAEQRVFNFSAGPAALPLSVLEQAREELLLYPGAGASVMEISHRSKQFEAVHAAAKENIRALLNVPENYHILFLQGGATLQFSMVPMNLLRGRSADYLYQGSWAKKAMSEAKKLGKVRVAWSGQDEQFSRMPRNTEYEVDPDAAYLHCTSNETIEGIEMMDDPNAGGVPVVSDMSSDFLSRPIDVAKYGIIYAGAQKNVGPSGVTIVLLRDDLLAGTPEGLPSMLDYKVQAEGDSLYNTPPCFGIYMIMLVTRWLREEIGGIDAMTKRNEEKAALLYDAIDQSGGFYKGHAKPDSRSKMNVTFRLGSEDLEKQFIKEATAASLDGLKGHRSVGGCRASIYNAMPIEGVQALRDFMREFQQKNG